MGPGTGSHPAAPRPGPPPPPVQERSSLANGAQTCPLQSHGECTLRSLDIKVIAYSRSNPGSDPRFFGVNADEPDFHRSPVLGTPVERPLKADHAMRGDRSHIGDLAVRAALGQYDLVLDVLAEGPTRDEPHPRGRILLEADAVYAGCCDTHSHPVIYEVPKTQCPELPAGGVFWKATKAEQRAFLAPAVGVFDTVQATNPFIWFAQLLMQLASGPKLVEVRANACGASHWYKLGNRDSDVYLNCLVRIFRKDKYSIKLKCASYVAASRSGSNMRALAGDGGTTRTSSTSTTVGGTTNTTKREGVTGVSDGAGGVKPATSVTTRSTEMRDVGAKHSTTLSQQTANAGHDPASPVTPFKGVLHERDGKNEEFVRTADGSAPPQGSGAAWQRHGDGWSRSISADTPPPRVELVLTRNDQALNVVEGLTKFMEGVFKLKETLENFNALLKKAPQLGWSFNATFSFLEGSVEGTMERVMEAAVVEKRYYPVGWQGTLTFQLMLISFSATASFGFKFDMGWFASAEATVNGTFKTDVPLKGIINTAHACEIALTPTITCDISGVAKASALGHAIAELRLSITGGLTIMEANNTPGGLVWTKSAGFGFKGDVYTTDVVGKFIATSAFGGLQPYEHLVLEHHKLIALPHPPPPH